MNDDPNVAIETVGEPTVQVGYGPDSGCGALTVGDLAEFIRDYPDDMPVAVEYPDARLGVTLLTGLADVRASEAEAAHTWLRHITKRPRWWPKRGDAPKALCHGALGEVDDVDLFREMVCEVLFEDESTPKPPRTSVVILAVH